MNGENTISMMLNFVIGKMDAVVIAGSSSYASKSSSYSEFEEIASAHPSEAFTSNRGLAFNLANSANLSVGFAAHNDDNVRLRISIEDCWFNRSASDGRPSMLAKILNFSVTNTSFGVFFSR